MVDVDIIFTPRGDLKIVIQLNGVVVFSHVFDLPDELFKPPKQVAYHNLYVQGKNQNKGVK